MRHFIRSLDAFLEHECHLKISYYLTMFRVISTVHTTGQDLEDLPHVRSTGVPYAFWGATGGGGGLAANWQSYPILFSSCMSSHALFRVSSGQ